MQNKNKIMAKLSNVEQTRSDRWVKQLIKISYQSNKW
jgi:hypothetical protein